MGGKRTVRASKRPLPRSFFERPSVEVAPELLGRLLTHTTHDGSITLRITEVEAYAGVGVDAASHTFRGRTKRNEVMFGDPGHLYVYFTYGMHWCANIVSHESGVAGAVLLRAGEVVHGQELAQHRRPSSKRQVDLASGPARLTTALGIHKEHDGLDVLAPSGPFALTAGDRVHDNHIVSGPRVGIRGDSAEWPWRFWLADDPTVSRWRPGKLRASR